MDDFTALGLGLLIGLAILPFLEYGWRRLPKVKRKGVADFLPWECIADGTVILRDGALMRLFAVHGPDLRTAREEEWSDLARQVEALLAHLSPDTTVGFELVHERARTDLGAVEGCPEVIAALDREHRTRLGQGFAHRQLVWLRLEPVSRTLDGMLHRLDEVEREALAHLDRFQPRRLGEVEAVNHLSNASGLPGFPNEVRSIRHAFSRGEDLHHSEGILAVGGRLHTVLAVQAYPESLRFDALALDLQVPARYVCTFRKPSAESVKNELGTLRRHWSRQRHNLFHAALEQLSLGPRSEESQHVQRVAEAIGGHLADLQGGSSRLGKATHTFVLSSTDRELLERETRHLASVLRTRGFSILRETWGLRQRFFDSLPGVRPPRELFSTAEEMGMLLPISGMWTGHRPDGGPLDGEAPLFLARRSGTRSDYTFRFSNVLRGVGHTIVLGPTGAGKSTLLSFLSSQWLARYPDARAITIDYGGSAVEAVRRTGGAVYDLSSSNVSLNPFEGIDEAGPRANALEWLTRTASIALGRDLETDEREDLAVSLEYFLTQTPDRRTLFRLVGLVQKKSLKGALGPYCDGGPLGDVLDRVSDTELAQSPWTVFEMKDFLHLDDRWSIPVLDALLDRLKKVFAEKRPLLLVLDEVWRFLQHPVLATNIKEFLLTLRKLNVSVVLASQNTVDFEPAFLQTVFQQCPSRVFLPDRTAASTLRQIYAGLGLDDHDCEQLASGRPRRDYYLVSERGRAMIDLHLSDDYLSFLKE